MQFGCIEGHVIMMWGTDGKPVDLKGYLCPICLGEILGPQLADRHFRMLWPRAAEPQC